MNIAIIKNNVAINVILVDSLALAQLLFPASVIIDTSVTPCEIGWLYDSDTGECTSPDPIEPEVVT